MKRGVLLAIACVAALLLCAAPVTANPPTRIPFEIDAMFPSAFLTAVCGIPVSFHPQGAETATLFYDQGRTQVIRELDTLAEGAATTIFSPLEAGSTGQSFTDV